jgi:type I site-specific restriction-modification system R (restriction) subunit
VLAFLKDYIVFAEKDEELNKYILRQHQTGAVEATVGRALDPKRTRGLVWHTQGSGKTFTMIKAAEMLFRAPEADKPTVLLMIDRNELEDQMLKNLAALACPVCGEARCVCKKTRKVKVKLAQGKERSTQQMMMSSFWHPDQCRGRSLRRSSLRKSGKRSRVSRSTSIPSRRRRRRGKFEV